MSPTNEGGIIEFKIVYFFNHLSLSPPLDFLTHFISWIPFLIIFWLVSALLALVLDKKNGKWIFIGSLIILVIYFLINDYLIKNIILSHIFIRARPYLAYPNEILSWGETWKDSSFPSGHLAMMAAFVTLYLYFYRSIWFWLVGLIIILLIAFSRMHNGMHYPLDIIVGIILGIGYGLLSIFIIKVFKERLNHT